MGQLVDAAATRAERLVAVPAQLQRGAAVERAEDRAWLLEAAQAPAEEAGVVVRVDRVVVLGQPLPGLDLGGEQVDQRGDLCLEPDPGAGKNRSRLRPHRSAAAENRYFIYIKHLYLRFIA